MKRFPVRIVLALAVMGLSALACSAPINAAPAPTQVPSAAQQPTAPAPVVPTAAAHPTEVATLPPASQPGNAPTNTPPPPATGPTAAPAVNQVTIYFVALDDGGKSGPVIGCGDSLVAVTRPVTPAMQPIQTALQELFSVKDQYVGQSGLYNALYQSNLVVDSVNVLSSGLAEVALSGQMQLGGVCDSPRFKAQIEQTIMAQPGISAANVTINGKTLDEVLSQK